MSDDRWEPWERTKLLLEAQHSILTAENPGADIPPPSDAPGAAIERMIIDVMHYCHERNKGFQPGDGDYIPLNAILKVAREEFIRERETMIETHEPLLDPYRIPPNDAELQEVKQKLYARQNAERTALEKQQMLEEKAEGPSKELETRHVKEASNLRKQFEEERERFDVEFYEAKKFARAAGKSKEGPIRSEGPVTTVPNEPPAPETVLDKDPITSLAWAHFAGGIGLEVRQAADIQNLGASEHLTARHGQQNADHAEEFKKEKDQVFGRVVKEWAGTQGTVEAELETLLTSLAERQFKEATALFENSGMGSDYALAGKPWEEHVSEMNGRFGEERERYVREYHDAKRLVREMEEAEKQDVFNMDRDMKFSK